MNILIVCKLSSRRKKNHQKILWIKEKLEDQFVKKLDSLVAYYFRLRKYFESAKLFGIEPTSNFAELKGEQIQ